MSSQQAHTEIVQSLWLLARLLMDACIATFAATVVLGNRVLHMHDSCCSAAVTNRCSSAKAFAMLTGRCIRALNLNRRGNPSLLHKGGRCSNKVAGVRESVEVSEGWTSPDLLGFGMAAVKSNHATLVLHQLSQMGAFAYIVHRMCLSQDCCCQNAERQHRHPPGDCSTGESRSEQPM